MKNATKVIQALVALHKAIGDAWSIEIRGSYSHEGTGTERNTINFQATTEREHRKLAALFDLTPSWVPNHNGKTESLSSKGVVAGIVVEIFAPSRPLKAPGQSDLKTSRVAGALALADEAVQP